MTASSRRKTLDDADIIVGDIKFIPGLMAREKAKILPWQAVEILVTAAHTDPWQPWGNSGERVVKVQEAIKAVKRNWPQYFK